MIKRSYTGLMLVAVLLSACVNNKDKTGQTAPADNTGMPVRINYAVSGTIPHDTSAFTEGLYSSGGKIYESTGSPDELIQTQSQIGIVDTITGKIIRKVLLDKHKYFGEGIAMLKNKIYQLTYTTNTGFIYDAGTFKKTGEFKFSNREGWGLTTDGSSLVMSDGTSTLTYISPDNFSVLKTIEVTDNNGPVASLNELEFIRGFIYANVFTTNRVIKIDPLTGTVAGEFDFSSLALEAKNLYSGSLEMNGIGYDSASKLLLVTGKLWPKIYKISFIH